MTTPYAAPWRVPRSEADSQTITSTQAPTTQVMAGAVVQSVEAETCTVLLFDETIPGVVFIGPPPQVGDIVEIEQRGDLWVIVTEEIRNTYVEGAEIDAPHIVDDTQPTAPGYQPEHVGGSMQAVSDWPLDGTSVTNGWTTDIAIIPAGLAVIPPATSVAAAQVWGIAEVEVAPNDLIRLRVTATTAAAVPKFQVVMAPDHPDASLDAPGGDGTLLVDLTATVPDVDGWVAYTVPASANFGTLGSGLAPALMRVGLQVAWAAASAPQIIERVEVERSMASSFPLGSLWLDPTVLDVSVSGAITRSAAATLTGSASTTLVDVPDADYLYLQCPADGLLQAFGNITVVLIPNNVAVMIAAKVEEYDGATWTEVGIYTFARGTMSVGGVNAQIPFVSMAQAPVRAGYRYRVRLQWRTASTGTWTVPNFYNARLNAVYHPGGVYLGEA